MTEHLESEQLLALAALRVRHDPRGLAAVVADTTLNSAYEHLTTCSYCEARLLENEAVFALLDGEDRPAAVSPALRSRVLASAAQVAPERASWSRLAIAAALAASVALAWFDGRGSNPFRLSDLAPHLASHCLSFQGAFSAIPLVVGMALSRAGKVRLEPLAFAAWSMGFAVLGQVALRTHCGAYNLSVHLFAFHFVGVLLAGLLGSGLGRLFSTTRAV
jgi:hypothetical protein